MTNLFVGFVVVGSLSLFYLLFQTHMRMEEFRSKYYAQSSQFDALYEYKERLEKSFRTLQEKTRNQEEKAVLSMDDSSAKDELIHLKSSCSRKIQTIQNELEKCREHLQVKSPPGSEPQSQSNNVPLSSSHFSQLVNLDKDKEEGRINNLPNEDTANNIII